MKSAPAFRPSWWPFISITDCTMMLKIGCSTAPRSAGAWTSRCWNTVSTCMLRPMAALETEARNRRYQRIADILEPGDVYLTAHHADDQAETLLLNLVRGAGLQGMAAIPECRGVGSGWVFRPLLAFHRQDLEHYLEQRGLEWCTDPSNEDRRYDRNFLRHDILPLLEQRWPGSGQRLARSARHARGSMEYLESMIRKQFGEAIENPVLFPVRFLEGAGQSRAALLLRAWLRQQQAPSLPESRLEELLRQIAASNRAEVSWSGRTIRRYREHLWLGSDN